LFEYFQQGAQQAYTIASTIVLRAGFWATKTTISWKVQVADGLPYLIGDRGKGHFFLDDRVGLVLKGDTTIHMDRARKLDLAWDETNPPEWAITIGDDRNLQDPAQRAFGKIETLVAGLRDLGVWTGVVVAGFSAAAALALTLGGQPAESTTTGASGANVGVLGGEFMPSHAMSLEAVPAISGGLTEHALYLPAVQTAGSTHPRPAGADIRVLRSELMASHTVGLGGVPVGSMTNLVDRVFALSAPGEVGQSIVGPFPV